MSNLLGLPTVASSLFVKATVMGHLVGTLSNSHVAHCDAIDLQMQPLKDAPPEVGTLCNSHVAHCDAIDLQMQPLKDAPPEVGSSIPSLTHLHAEVSLGKMLNPEAPPPHRITKCCD
ncbi:unnamed protein product [Pleuronectes platessa]|uniref:Uncharacterized protein n=1 Tax=Pleuronectes platessa TaxID=8262 RepID=A0A9N7UXB7_PLEPL|nr:unnamed protein product [Pleuronectes platessa]